MSPIVRHTKPPYKITPIKNPPYNDQLYTTNQSHLVLIVSVVDIHSQDFIINQCIHDDNDGGDDFDDADDSDDDSDDDNDGNNDDVNDD